jgi:hypothetical protein
MQIEAKLQAQRGVVLLALPGNPDTVRKLVLLCPVSNQQSWTSYAAVAESGVHCVLQAAKTLRASAGVKMRRSCCSGLFTAAELNIMRCCC